jgi:predicted site-specific integrase-resolvase
MSTDDAEVMLHLVDRLIGQAKTGLTKRQKGATMIRAALYARFSSENQKESSITDQFRNCERRASRERWQIVQRYKDEGISGSSNQRPGYQAMLQDAKAKRFDLLLVDDLSRLTRDEAELITTRKCLVFWKIGLVW